MGLKCILKIDGTTIDDSEDLVMPMYNLIQKQFALF